MPDSEELHPGRPSGLILFENAFWLEKQRARPEFGRALVLDPWANGLNILHKVSHVGLIHIGSHNRGEGHIVIFFPVKPDSTSSTINSTGMD